MNTSSRRPPASRPAGSRTFVATSKRQSPRFKKTRYQGSSTAKRGKAYKQAIDIARFIHKPIMLEETITPDIKHTFADFGLRPELEHNLAQRKFTTPTPIQDQAIPVIMKGRDIVGLANTGTGKTGAFLLPLIDKVCHDRTQRVLILAPTRELAQQIEMEFRDFARGTRLYSTVCVGGMSAYRQISDLRRNPQFVIGTPGRLKDLSERGALRLASFNNVVIDEVDHMMDMGFIEPIKQLLKALPTKRQSLFFSATMPVRIRELMLQFVHDPVTVEVKSTQTVNNIEQDIVRVKDHSMKFDQLREILSSAALKKVLIFAETKREVEKLARELATRGFKAGSIHGDKKQRERQLALSQFKGNGLTILVATDVAARGIDVKDITHVINYTIPNTHDDYVHRIGRTGRGTSKGKALTFVH